MTTRQCTSPILHLHRQYNQKLDRMASKMRLHHHNTEKKVTLQSFGSRSSHEVRLFNTFIISLMFLISAAQSFMLVDTRIPGSVSLPTLSWCHGIQQRFFAVSVSQSQPPLDPRPHEQRATGPRMARRLNHGFRYLYRQNTTQFQDMSSLEYLSQYYSLDDIYQMNQTFPPLLELNVSRHLHPKMQFLQHTMGVSNTTIRSSLQNCIPPQFFGARLERIIAPRHAFLMYMGLPHGRRLIENPDQWKAFLTSCRTTKRFMAFCQEWQRRQEIVLDEEPIAATTITSKQIEAFDTLFGRGILAAARNELCQSNNTWPLEHLPDITSAHLIQLMIDHGANPLELDNGGISLLHWAAGTGNLQAVEVLLTYVSEGVLSQTQRDGATPLHWAAAGANSKEFGVGGHADVCQYLLTQCSSIDRSTKELVNQVTLDGNSPLMWASWSGTLDTVKLMIWNRADSTITNKNGCTAAHWAASGGNLEVCQYLADVVGVDFQTPNHGGHTPLTHAVAFGRLEIVQWLRERQLQDDDDGVAAALAENFYIWTDGEDDKRTQMLKLFRDDYWDTTTATTTIIDESDGDVVEGMAPEFELEK